MIVELFGPPGVGKTTLAGALGTRLRESGHAPKLILSYRPNEYAVHRGEDAARQPPGAALRRLARPAIEMLALVASRQANRPDASAAAALIAALPPRSLLWRFRMRQYLSRLGRSWEQAAGNAGIAVIDQGFVQAVYSLASLGGPVERHRVARALRAAPQPDLLIRLDAPREILADRLHARWQRQSRAERLLDSDVATNLQTLPLIDLIGELAQLQGLPVLRVEVADRPALDDATRQIEGEILAWLRAGHREAA